MTSNEAQAQEFTFRLQNDPIFRQRFEQDPVTALEAAGFADIALEVQQTGEKANELAQRLERDAAFRVQVEQDPLGALQGAGIPAPAVEPFLRALGAPSETLQKASAEVSGYFVWFPILYYSLQAARFGLPGYIIWRESRRR